MNAPAHVNETKLQDMLFLAAPKAFPELRLFRRNVGTVRIEDRVIRFSVKGQCDVWGIWRGGRHVELELKSKKGRLNPEQEAWRDFCVEREIPWLLLKPEPQEAPETTVRRWLSLIQTTRS